MLITYRPAASEDIDRLYQLNKALIDTYESVEHIDYHKVLQWVRRKLETCISEYTTVYADGEKAGYYHFCKNEDDEYELDDLYIFPEFQGQGIGSAAVEQCCSSVSQPVMLYVFIRNERAVALYKRLGFTIIETVHGTRYIMKRDNRKYYEAYEERYKAAHEQGVSWASEASTPIVLDMLRKHHIAPDQSLLEVGCGEGRDSKAVLDGGYSLLATDISKEAIAYCKTRFPQYESRFRVLDCLSDTLEQQFDFIFGIAVIHMLVPDADRDGFYQFIRGHLTANGLALICTMGDGEFETQSDISTAFSLQEREHQSGTMTVAGTSCRMVSFPTFERELARNGLEIVEKGLTEALPDFNSLMYALVKRT